MTDVAFHFNAPEPLDYACRLLRKAVASGAKVVVTGLPETLRQLDADLWSVSPVDFVPHCLLRGDPRVIAASPVILTTQPANAPHQQVLLNLGATVPQGYEAFERVIEVVSLDEDDRVRARQRWKQYAAQGHPILRHDLHLKPTDA